MNKYPSIKAKSFLTMAATSITLALGACSGEVHIEVSSTQSATDELKETLGLGKYSAQDIEQCVPQEFKAVQESIHRAASEVAAPLNINEIFCRNIMTRYLLQADNPKNVSDMQISSGDVRGKIQDMRLAYHHMSKLQEKSVSKP